MIVRIFLPALLLLAHASPEATAQVKKWTDAEGKVHYGDRPPENADAEKVTTKVSSYDSQIDGSGAPEIVLLFARKDCLVCDMARQHFIDNDIPFTEYDIDLDPLANKRFKRAGGREAPLIAIGNRIMRQFSPGTFDRIYSRFRKYESTVFLFGSVDVGL